jgi:hypothetical protein
MPAIVPWCAGDLTPGHGPRQQDRAVESSAHRGEGAAGVTS